MGDDASAFDRGHTAGGIAERLASHDRHFEAINGSLADIAQEMHELTLAVQRLGDQAVSRDATVLTTAAALRDADKARREKSDGSWSPVAKLITAVLAVTAVVGVIIAIQRG